MLHWTRVPRRLLFVADYKLLTIMYRRVSILRNRLLIKTRYGPFKFKEQSLYFKEQRGLDIEFSEDIPPPGRGKHTFF